MATRVSLHKAGKRSESEVVSVVHFDKEVADKIKKLLRQSGRRFLKTFPQTGAKI